LNVRNRSKYSRFCREKNTKISEISRDGIKRAVIGFLSLSESGLRDDLLCDPGTTQEAAERRIHLHGLRVRGAELVGYLRLQRLADGDQASDLGATPQRPG
jgi:hypothetical protein